MKFRWIRNFLKGCSLTTALFVFQACYGTGPGYELEQRDFNFEVVDKNGKAIDKAKILMKRNSTFSKWTDSVETGKDGLGTLWISGSGIPNPTFRIEAEGYESLDTVTTPELLNSEIILVKLNKK